MRAKQIGAPSGQKLLLNGHDLGFHLLDIFLERTDGRGLLVDGIGGEFAC